ncbi:MAG: hypothetical protein Q7R90_01695 [bacterium]|nr:hypothetical protein [bacterium]
MDDKKAIELLTKMLTKHPLTDEEKEAVREAIGILAWTKLMEGRVKSMKKGRDKKMNSED